MEKKILKKWDCPKNPNIKKTPQYSKFPPKSWKNEIVQKKPANIKKNPNIEKKPVNIEKNPNIKKKPSILKKTQY